MDSKSSTGAINPEPQVRQKQHIGTSILAIAMLLMPPLQLYIALKPWIQMAEFLPMEMIIRELGSTALMANAACIAGVLMMIGGLLLLLRSPWGWAFGISAITFSLFWTLESLGFGAAMVLKEGGFSQEMVEIIFEFLAMTYYAPVIFLVVYILGVPWLFRRSIREELQVMRVHRIAAWGIGIFLLVDLHLTLAMIYMQSAV